MSCFNTLAKATTVLATAGLASTTILNVPSAHASNSTNCENGQLIGTFALRSERNQQFVKKDDGILKASKNSQPTGTNNKGVFEIYSLKDMPGATDRAFALRSTRNNKWWRVTNGSEVVRLESYQCRSDRDSTTFIGRGGYGALSLQSRKNGKWIKVLSNEKLKAKADNPESKTVFRLVAIGQSSNPQPNQPSNPTPQTQRINGWFKGNRSGYYTTQTSGTSFQMKAFTDAGKLLNRFEGTISGNRVTGTWKNYCNNRSGDATLLYQNRQLRRIAGNTANTRWTPIQRPTIQLESQPSCR